jgi:hypothetical protein
MFIPDEVGFRSRALHNDRDISSPRRSNNLYFIYIYIYIPNNTNSKYMRQKLKEPQGKQTTIAGDWAHFY